MFRKMKIESVGVVLAVILGGAAGFTPSPAAASSQWDMGISGSSDGVRGFHLSVGEYYNVPEREVEVIHDRGVDDDELPVVFYVAQCARVRPRDVVVLRRRGMSWMDITDHYRLSPEIYYVPVRVADERFPYGRGWKHYRGRHGHRGWRNLRLHDDEVVNQVNLRFISDHYRYAPERVMRERAGGRRFAAIEREIRSERGERRDGGDSRRRGEDRYERGSDRREWDRD